MTDFRDIGLPIMKVFSNEVTFDYSWEEVSTANWMKYCPWNEHSSHVIGVDTISRHVDPETGIVSFSRASLLACRFSSDWDGILMKLRSYEPNV